MKKVKKFIGFALLPTVALLVAGYALHGKKADTLSDLAKENVEALASAKPVGDLCSQKCFDCRNMYCLLETPESYVYCFSKFPRKIE